MSEIKHTLEIRSVGAGVHETLFVLFSFQKFQDDNISGHTAPKTETRLKRLLVSKREYLTKEKNSELSKKYWIMFYGFTIQIFFELSKLERKCSNIFWTIQIDLFKNNLNSQMA